MMPFPEHTLHIDRRRGSKDVIRVLQLLLSPECIVENGRLHPAGEHGFLVLFLGFGGRGVGFGVGGDFGKVNVFAVGEVRGGFGVGLVVVGFGVHGGFVGGLGRVGGVGKGDFGGGVFGHVVGASWLAWRLVLLVCLVDGGGFVEGGRMVGSGWGRGCGIIIIENGRLNGILYFVSPMSICSSWMLYLADVGLPNGRSHCRSCDCILHLLILRPPSFGISLLVTWPSLRTRRPCRLAVNFRLENSLDRWLRRVWGGVVRVRSTVILHRVHPGRWSCSSQLLSISCWGRLRFLL
jgi:hypothetical protein